MEAPRGHLPPRPDAHPPQVLPARQRAARLGAASSGGGEGILVFGVWCVRLSSLGGQFVGVFIIRVFLVKSLAIQKHKNAYMLQICFMDFNCGGYYDGAPPHTHKPVLFSPPSAVLPPTPFFHRATANLKRKPSHTLLTFDLTSRPIVNALSLEREVHVSCVSECSRRRTSSTGWS